MVEESKNLNCETKTLVSCTTGSRAADMHLCFRMYTKAYFHITGLFSGGSAFPMTQPRRNLNILLSFTDHHRFLFSLEFF